MENLPIIWERSSSYLWLQNKPMDPSEPLSRFWLSVAFVNYLNLLFAVDMMTPFSESLPCRLDKSDYNYLINGECRFSFNFLRSFFFDLIVRFCVLSVVLVTVHNKPMPWTRQGKEGSMVRCTERKMKRLIMSARVDALGLWSGGPGFEPHCYTISCLTSFVCSSCSFLVCSAVLYIFHPKKAYLSRF